MKACPSCRSKLGQNCDKIAGRIRSDPEFAQLIYRRLTVKGKMVFAEIFGHSVLGMELT